MPPAPQTKPIGQLTEHPRRARALADRPLPIAGFGGGTLIATDDGPVPVEWLRPGDRVLTYSDGFQPVRWIGRDCLRHAPDTIPAVRLPVHPQPRNQKPLNPLLAARHRVVLTGWQVELYFGLDAILAEAAMLCDERMCFPGIKPGINACSHVLLDRPQIIQVNGAWVESMQLSTGTVECLGDPAAETIDRLDLDLAAHVQPALGTLSLWEAQQLGLELPTLLARDASVIARG